MSHLAYKKNENETIASPTVGPSVGPCGTSPRWSRYRWSWWVVRSWQAAAAVALAGCPSRRPRQAAWAGGPGRRPWPAAPAGSLSGWSWQVVPVGGPSQAVPVGGPGRWSRRASPSRWSWQAAPAGGPGSQAGDPPLATPGTVSHGSHGGPREARAPALAGGSNHQRQSNGSARYAWQPGLQDITRCPYITDMYFYT